MLRKYLETNLEFIIGCELQKIAFSLFQLMFLCTNEISISVEGRCRLEGLDGQVLML